MMGNPQRKLKILLVEGASLSARQTLYSLGPGNIIHIMDPNPICQARFSRFVSRYFRCPWFSREPEAYLGALFDRLRKEKYDVLIPTHEQMFLLAKFKRHLTSVVGFAAPELDRLQLLQSKVAFARLAKVRGLSQPPFAIINTRKDLEGVEPFPLFVKEDYSTGGSGVYYVKNRQQLRALADKLQAAGLLDGRNDLLIQQPAKGIQSTVQAVFQEGRLVASHCFEARALGVGGMSMARVSVSHLGVVEDIRRLGSHLSWHGALFADYFYDASTGSSQFIEANPRIGETVNALLSGVNLCQVLVQVSLGEVVSPLLLGRAGVLSDSDFMVLMADAIKGATRREIAAELLRSLRGVGIYHQSENELTRPRSDLLSLIPAGVVTALLLINPRWSNALVRKTISDYSLSESAVERIGQMEAPAL